MTVALASFCEFQEPHDDSQVWGINPFFGPGIAMNRSHGRRDPWVLVTSHIMKFCLSSPSMHSCLMNCQSFVRLFEPSLWWKRCVVYADATPSRLVRIGGVLQPIRASCAVEYPVYEDCPPLLENDRDSFSPLWYEKVLNITHLIFLFVVLLLAFRIDFFEFPARLNRVSSMSKS